MNQYTNLISKLKSFPQLGIFGRKKRKQSYFVQAIQNAAAARQKAIVKAVETKAEKERREKQERLVAEAKARRERIAKLDTDVFDKEFADFKLAYKPPKPEKAVTKKEIPVLPKRPVVDVIPPTPDEYALYREYDSKGIFFKTNLKAVTNRDDNGNILVTVGEDIAQTISIDGQSVVKVETIVAPKSGHSKISLNINKKN